MRRLLVLSLLVVVGCKKAPDQVGPEAQNVPEPADLIAVASVASPKAALARLKAYAEAVSPGAAGAIKEEMIPAALSEIVGAQGLDGLDLDKPLHLLVLDPKKQKKPLLLGTVADEAKVKLVKGATVKVEGKLALIGADADVSASSAYAFGVVGRRAAPTAATVVCSPKKLADLYRADIEKLSKELPAMMQGQAASMGRVLQIELELFLKLADQTDEARLSADAVNGEAVIDVALVPRAGTTFEAFAKAQKAGVDVDRLSRLPGNDKPTMVMVGSVQFGPVRGPILDLLDGIMEPVLGKKPDRAAWNAWLDGLDGSMAAVTWSDANGALNMDEIAGATDGVRSAAQATALFTLPPGEVRTMEFVGLKMSFETKPEAAGVFEYIMKPDYTTMPALQGDMMKRMYGEALHMVLAGADKSLVLGMGPDAAARAARSIEIAAKGGGMVPSDAVKAALHAARDRKASVAIFMDIARSMAALVPNAPSSSSGMLMEMGVTGGAARVRIGVPAAHVRELMGAFGAR
jgi:hypothetical protein